MNLTSPFQRWLVTAIGACFVVSLVIADERRAPVPKFEKDETGGVFFGSLEEAFRAGLPSLSKLRAASEKQMQAQSSGGGNAGKGDSDSEGSGNWEKLISASSIEDEIKRLRLHYDTVVSTPGAFNGGGYLEARLDLSVLATLFAVINDFKGEVRWKKDAPVARDLIARTAYNCKAGSTQVYNEAKLRKQDLADLVSGGGLTGRDSEPENDWSSIVDRSPMMEYLELLIGELEDGVRDEKSFRGQIDAVQRNAELLSLVGEVLIQEGMDEADDEDYQGLSDSMTEQSVQVVKAIGRDDYDSVRQGVAAIRQRCDACHEQYR